MAVFNPESHLWTIENWLCKPGQRGGSFTIWASPRFLQEAQKIKTDQVKAQQRAQLLIREAGWELQDYERDFLRFGEWGVVTFIVPGNACSLSLEHNDPESILRRGGTFLPHNVDTPLQQSTLMTLWLMWVNHVEGQMWQKRREESKESRGKAS